MMLSEMIISVSSIPTDVGGGGCFLSWRDDAVIGIEFVFVFASNKPRSIKAVSFTIRK